MVFPLWKRDAGYSIATILLDDKPSFISTVVVQIENKVKFIYKT
jgi:hypothetical protein